MGMTLDQVLDQLNITAAAFQRIDIPGTVLPTGTPDQVHFIAVLDGDGELACQDGALAVAKGQLVLLPPDAAPRCGHNLVLAHGLLCAKLLDGRSLFSFLAMPHRQEAGDTELLTGAIPELLRESAYGGPGSAAIITCLARRLVTTLVRDEWPSANEILPPGIASQQERLAKILELLKKDPARDYTLDSLASAAGMSRTVFHRLFTQTYGSSPLALLRQLRLKRAEELLTLTDMPIKTISGRLGYRSRSHFWKLFRDTHGVDPEQYRLQAKSE